MLWKIGNCCLILNLYFRCETFSQLTILDLSGRLIDAGVLTGKLDQIDVSSYQSGLYILSFEGNKAIKFIKK